MRNAKKLLSPYIPIDNIYIVCYNYLCHYDCCVIQLNDIITPWPSGKAPDLESGIRWFESSRGSLLYTGQTGKALHSE